VKSQALIVGLVLLSNCAIAQSEDDVSALSILGDGSMIGLVDAQYHAVCEKQVNATTGESKVANQEECRSMLNRLELALTQTDGCMEKPACLRLVAHVRELKQK